MLFAFKAIDRVHWPWFYKPYLKINQNKKTATLLRLPFLDIKNNVFKKSNSHLTITEVLYEKLLPVIRIK